MRIDSNIKFDVVRTLDSLKNLPEVEPNPFLYTNVMRQLEGNNKDVNNYNKQMGIVFTLILFFIINSTAIYFNIIKKENYKIRNEIEIQIAEEYCINYKTQ